MKCSDDTWTQEMLLPQLKGTSLMQSDESAIVDCIDESKDD